MDRGQRRANERTSRQDFGVLKARKQSRVVKKLFYPFRLVLRAIDGELFDVHENGVPPSNCSNDFKSGLPRLSLIHRTSKRKSNGFSLSSFAKIEYAELTADDQLRATFLGWRDDKNPNELLKLK